MDTSYIEILKVVSNPLLVIVGFVILLFLGLVRSFLEKDIFSKLTRKDSGHIVKKTINYMFIIVAFVVALSFSSYIAEMFIDQPDKKPNFQLKEFE